MLEHRIWARMLLGRLGVIFPRYLNGVAAVNVTLFSDVPSRESVRQGSAIRRHRERVLRPRFQTLICRRNGDQFFACSTIVTPLGPSPVIWTITSPSFAHAK